MTVINSFYLFPKSGIKGEPSCFPRLNTRKKTVFELTFYMLVRDPNLASKIKMN